MKPPFREGRMEVDARAILAAAWTNWAPSLIGEIIGGDEVKWFDAVRRQNHFENHVVALNQG